MVTLPTFIKVKPNLLRAKLPKVNSFYLGEKILKGHTTLGLPEWEKGHLVLDGFPCVDS